MRQSQGGSYDTPPVQDGSSIRGGYEALAAAAAAGEILIS